MARTASRCYKASTRDGTAYYIVADNMLEALRIYTMPKEGESVSLAPRIETLELVGKGLYDSEVTNG